MRQAQSSVWSDSSNAAFRKVTRRETGLEEVRLLRLRRLCLMPAHHPFGVRTTVLHGKSRCLHLRGPRIVEMQQGLAGRVGRGAGVSDGRWAFWGDAPGNTPHGRVPS